LSQAAAAEITARPAAAQRHIWRTIPLLSHSWRRCAANLRRGQETTSARREQELSANTLPLQSAIHSQAAPYDLRRLGIVNRCGAQAVEAEEGFVVGIVNRKERLRAAQFVAPAGITAREFTQRFFAAVERFRIVILVDRLVVPRRHDYDRFGNARAAASSLVFGAGGFSSRSRTRKTIPLGAAHDPPPGQRPWRPGRDEGQKSVRSV